MNFAAREHRPHLPRSRMTLLTCLIGLSDTAMARKAPTDDTDDRNETAARRVSAPLRHE